MKLSRNAIADGIVCLLHDAGADAGLPYLVYAETDPDLTIETDGFSITAKIKGNAVPFTGETIDRASAILAAPLFDYK